MKDKEYVYCKYCHAHFKRNQSETIENGLIRCLECGKVIMDDPKKELIGTIDDLNMRLI